MTDHVLDDLDPRYAVILCDIWGVVHDGRHLLPGAKERLLRWMSEGRRVVLVTNAPRPASTIEGQLDALGLPRDAWTEISSSGAAGIAALVSPARPVGFLGYEDDRIDLVGAGVELVEASFVEIACTGLEENSDVLADYIERLERWAADDVLLHCLNPDRFVIHHGMRIPCAGLLAETYEALGGRVTWYGKPEPAIYAHALALAGDPPLDAVLAVGDGLPTDMAGAARMGIDAVFVDSGLHAGETLSQFGDWRPAYRVESL